MIKNLYDNKLEQPLYWYGSCNLGPINLSNHVKNIFTEKAEIDWKQLEKSIIMLTIMLDKLLDISYYPIEKQAIEVQEKRLIGLGFTGLGDMFSKLCIPYGSQKSIEVAEQVTKFISEVSYLTSSKLAKEFGKFPAYDYRILESYNVSQLSPEIKEHIEKHGLRNSRLTSVAPVGTISLLLNNCSSGIEPNFALEYTRKIIGADGVEFFETVETDAWNLFKNSELYNGEIPDFFVTAQDLKPIDHINVQAAVQKWICTAVSKTTNCPKEISFDDFKEIYDLAYEKGLKGCTTYRPNDVLGSILEVKKEFDPKTSKEEQDEFFEAWKTQSTDEVRIDDVSLPSEYPMKGYKITSEGKKWYVHVAFKDKKLKKPFAIFATTNNKERNIETYDTLEKLTSLAEKSGIRKELIEQNEQKSLTQTNVNKMCRILGMLLRHNVPIVEIVKTLDNVEVPVSSFIFRIKKFLLSFIDEIETTGEKCPECGSPVKFESGCKSCTDCFWSKCS